MITQRKYRNTPQSEGQWYQAKNTVAQACYHQLWEISAVSMCLSRQYADTPRLHIAIFIQTDMPTNFILNKLFEEFCGI